EPISSLQRAHWILLTKCHTDHLPELEAAIRKHNRTAEIVLCQHKLVHLQDLVSDMKVPLDFLKGKRLGAICAIARPESFENALVELGAEVAVRMHFEDHHRYTERDLRSFLERCVRRDLDAVVTTEKDAVKFPPLPNAPLPVYFLRMQIDILAGQESWQRLLDYVCQDQPIAFTRRHN
ncbi:MAG: tetraacyldisaccharide 4'-kinase, partial [Verrucomicrobiia bacterium]